MLEVLPSPEMLSSLLRGQKRALQSCLNGCVILGNGQDDLESTFWLRVLYLEPPPTPRDCNKSVASIINSNNVRLFAHAP